MRKSLVKALIWTLGLVAISALGMAKFGLQQFGELQVTCRDSQTGETLTKTHVVLRHLDSGEAEIFGGPELLEGRYIVEVREEGYEMLAAESVVTAGQTSSLLFHLDPLTPKQSAPLQRGRMLITGYVIDDATGLPLSDVTVGTAKSDKTGHFAEYKPAGTRYLVCEFTKSGYKSQVHSFIESWPGGDAKLKIRMRRGAGTETTDHRKLRHRNDEQPPDAPGCDMGCDEKTIETNDLPFGSDSLNAPALPKSIRVGRNCPTATTCTTVEVYSVDTYCEYVLAAEWYSCWGSLSGGMNSLKAGAVAVRSYGLYHVYNPRAATYDICDTTSCQVFGATGSTNAHNAVLQTTGFVLTQNGAITRSEYAAENNNNGCGDGFTGTGSGTNPCISDSVCSGFADNGHGRGLCQWGSARWANGTRVSTASPCSAGPSHGLGQQSWQWILGHYYPQYTLESGATADLTNLTALPNPAYQATTVILSYPVTTSGLIDGVIVGASIRRSGTTTLISDPAHDLLVNLPGGLSSQQRSFDLSANLEIGTYDLLGTLYFDRNGSGSLNSGDFIMDDFTSLNGLVVQSQNINVSVNPSRAKLLPAASIQLVAVVQNSTNQSVTWSIQSGQGSVSPNGLFTAPSSAASGPVKTIVKATSVANPSRSGLATIFTAGRN